MADIFLSYASDDRAIARRISDALEAIGWSVWWDREIPAGQTWRDVLEKALGDMRCMVVLWSHNSIKSEWVKEEAEEGQSQCRLVPVMIDDVKPPIGFRAVQAADLIGWDGSTESPGFQQIVTALQSTLGKPTAPTVNNTRDQAENGARLATLARWAEGLPWWSYAAATVLIAMLVAASLRHSMPATQAHSPGSLPVTNPRSAGPQELKPADRSPTSAISNPGDMPVEKVPARKLLNSRSKATPLPSGPGSNNRCGDILARAQLGEPLSDSERDTLRKECQ